MTHKPNQHPREFWIWERKGYHTSFMYRSWSDAEEDRIKDEVKDLIHVIEMSAYRELESKLAEANSRIMPLIHALEKHGYKECDEKDDKIKSLEAKLEMAKAGFRSLKEWSRLYEYPEHEIRHALAVDIPHEIDEALAEIEGKDG